MADDLELLRGFVERGEEGAFGEVVGRNARWMFAAAYRQVRDVEAAEDVVQGVFVLLAQRAGKVVRGGNVAGWLFLTVQNVVRNVRRNEMARKRREMAAAAELGREREVAMRDVNELGEVLDGAVEKLPGKYREAVVMRFYREMEFGEVARRLGTSEAGARKRVERGVEMLRGKLGAQVTAGMVSAGVLQGSLLAPAGLGETAARAALSAKAGVGAGATGVSAGTKGAVMAAAKVKVVAAVVLVGAVTVPTAVVVKRMSAPAATAGPGVVAVAESGPAEAVGKFTVSVATTGIVSPLRADGRPDYARAINEKYGGGVKPEENAFVGWLEVAGAGNNVLAMRSRDTVVTMSGAAPPAKGLGFALYDSVLKRAGKENDQAAINEEIDAARRLWREGDYPEVAIWLNENGAFLDRMASVWKRPRYWYPMVGDTSLFGALLPQLGTMREAGNALTARALLRMADGDFEGFLADVQTVQRMGRRLASSYTMVEALMGNALDAQASRAIGAAAGSGRLTSGQLSRVEKAMEEAGTMPEEWPNVDCCARWGTLDFELMVAMGKADDLALGFDSRQFEKEWGEFRTIDAAQVDWDEVLRETNGAMDEEVAAMKESTSAGMRAGMKALVEKYGIGKKGEDLGWESGETREAYSKRVAMGFLKKLLADYTTASLVHRGAMMQEEMARAVVAAARSKAEGGKWPEELTGLPVDVYSKSGADLVKYVVGAGGVRVYSVGRNGVDEGGSGDDVVVGVRGE